MDESIDCMQNACLDTLTKVQLDNVFLALQKCMESTIMASGGNNYKIEHTNEEKLRYEGRLPILCSQSSIQTAELSLSV